MFNRTWVFRLFVVALVTSAGALLAGRAVAESPSLANSIPPGALAFGEVADLESVIDRVQDSDYLKQVVESPQFQDVANSQQYKQAQAGRAVLEKQLGMDLWTVGKKLLGNRIAVAVYPKPNSKQPDAVAIIQVKDAKTLVDLRKQVEPLLVLTGAKIKQSENGDGVELVAINDNAFFAINDKWIAASSNRDLLTKTVELLSGEKAASLAQDEAYQLMSKKMGSEHLGRVFVNTGTLAEATGGRFGLPEKMDNPLFSLLVGGILELAVHSPYAGLTLDVEENQFAISVGISGERKKLGETFSPFFATPPETGTRPIPAVPQLIGGVTIYRDFADWYGRREELLQPQILPAFDKFEAGLGNLLPGRDFGEDVLPQLGKNITLVAARQDYSHLEGKPGVKLPGFAAIFELGKPDEGAQTFQLFFQTLSAILNIQAGQQGRKPWLLDTELYKDVKVSYGRYLKKPEGDRLPLVFNFMPASARVGDKFIISSSVDLCRNLIDALKKPENNKRVEKNFNLELQFDPFADIIEANQDFFQAQRIQQGRTIDEAKQDMAAILDVLRQIKSLDFNTTATNDAFTVQLKGAWK
jgi:hypothetical protein